MKRKASRYFSLVLILLSSVGLKAQVNTLMADYSTVTLERYIQIAKENYPRVRSLQLRTDMAKNNVTIQSLNWLDPLSFTFIYAPNYSFNIIDPTYFDGIQVGISLNLSTFLQKGFNVKSRKLELKVAQSDQAEYLLSLENAVTKRYVAFIQAKRALISQSESEIASQNIFEQTEIKYNKSQVSFLEYSQAIQSRNSAQTAKISAEASYLNAKADLEELLTRRLEEIK